MGITSILLILNIGASLAAFNDPALKGRLMFSPYRVKHHNEWWRVVTHAFVHKDWMHLIFNMYVLWMFGEIIEYELSRYFPEKGKMLYVLLYFGGLIFATFPSTIRHSENDMYWSLGASGAVSAVVFAFIFMHPDQNLYLLFIPIGIPAAIFGILYLSYEIYMDKRGDSGVAHDAHIWGALFGIILLILIDFDFLRHFIETVKGLF